MLRDIITIHIRAGRGGNGSNSVVKRTPTKQIPEGGNGGNGGDVICVADNNVADLEYFVFNKMFSAKNGQPGGRNKKSGQNGEAIILRVPCGTILRNEETGLLIRTLEKPGDQVVVARGGRGGFGNAYRQTKRDGKSGEEFSVKLEYLIPADVFIVGMPNVGKSSLLHCVSDSKVRVNDKPFSTEFPTLGVFDAGDYRTVTFCELPAVIKGSSEGKGIGSRFLKHCASAQVIVIMLDPLTRFAESLVAQYKIIKQELNACDESFLEKHVVIAITNIDRYDMSLESEVVERLKNVAPVFCLSHETGEGVDAFVAHIKDVTKGSEG